MADENRTNQNRNDDMNQGQSRRTAGQGNQGSQGQNFKGGQDNPGSQGNKRKEGYGQPNQGDRDRDRQSQSSGQGNPGKQGGQGTSNRPNDG